MLFRCFPGSLQERDKSAFGGGGCRRQSKVGASKGEADFLHLPPPKVAGFGSVDSGHNAGALEASVSAC